MTREPWNAIIKHRKGAAGRRLVLWVNYFKRSNRQTVGTGAVTSFSKTNCKCRQEEGYINKRYHILWGILLLSLLLLCGCSKKNSEAPAATDPGTETADEPPAQDEPPSDDLSPEESAPVFITFEGMDLDGNVISEDIFSQSKLTMVNVWATFCNPCLNEMPALGELAAEYDRAEFQIIGIVSDVREGEDQTLVESLVQETGANYPHLLANDSIDQIGRASCRERV